MSDGSWTASRSDFVVTSKWMRVHKISCIDMFIRYPLDKIMHIFSMSYSKFSSEQTTQPSTATLKANIMEMWKGVNRSKLLNLTVRTAQREDIKKASFIKTCRLKCLNDL